MAATNDFRKGERVELRHGGEKIVGGKVVGGWDWDPIVTIQDDDGEVRRFPRSKSVFPFPTRLFTAFNLEDAL